MSAERPAIHIRDARPEEFADLGRLMVGAYATLDGFPSPELQPRYYEMLANIGDFTRADGARLLVAVMPNGDLAGGVVYFQDMAQYGSGGIATTIKDAAGLRLLGVSPRFRELGVGKALTRHCIELAQGQGLGQVILHTTQAMSLAWGMYERLGFVRSPDLDFLQQDLPVFGFRLALTPAPDDHGGGSGPTK
jgi:ribosomal protein S18 acetylase RimI-like enzyme